METTISLAEELGMTKEAITNKARILGIKKTSGRYRFTEKQADMIREHKRIPSFVEKYHKRKISIIEFFLSNKNNTREELSDSLELPISRIDATINEWCENNHYIVVESKINVQCIE